MWVRSEINCLKCIKFGSRTPDEDLYVLKQSIMFKKGIDWLLKDCACTWFLFLFFLHFFYASVLVTAVAWGNMYSGCTPHFCECDISRMPWGNIFKLVTNIHLDSGKNVFRICCSEVIVTSQNTWTPGHNPRIHKISMTRYHLNVEWRWWSDDFLFPKRSALLWHDNVLYKHFSCHH